MNKYITLALLSFFVVVKAPVPKAPIDNTVVDKAYEKAIKNYKIKENLQTERKYR